MKLASLKHGRDGKLVLVSRDLSRAVDATPIAATLQHALDNWESVEPELRALYDELNEDKAPGDFPFDQTKCASPLPRAFQWADGSAYVNHVELVRRARNAEMPATFWTDPLIYQGGSDDFIGPRDDILVPSEDWGIDFEGEIAVITGDVPMGTGALAARNHIRLLMLVNDVSLRGLIPGELAKGFGFFQSKPASAFSPVAVTPDELGNAWRDAKVHLPLLSFLNEQPFGKPDAGTDMTFDFGQLIAHVCKSRNMSAGSILGSGTVSNKQGTGHGSAIDEGGVGYSCIAEIRMIETIREGQPATPFMRFGDRVRIEMRDREGRSVFGSIDQRIRNT